MPVRNNSNNNNYCYYYNHICIMSYVKLQKSWRRIRSSSIKQELRRNVFCDMWQAEIYAQVKLAFVEIFATYFVLL